MCQSQSRIEVGSICKLRHAKSAFHHAWSQCTRKGVCGIENDLKSTFDGMSQAALWRVMNLFDTEALDVGLMEKINDGSGPKWCRKSNDHVWYYRCSSRKHHSPWLLNVAINALFWILAVTMQDRGISHDLQIGKDHQDHSQELIMVIISIL